VGISLSKGQTLSLEKSSGGSLTHIRMGLGWDPVKPKGFFGKLMGGGDSIDLDASCLLLDSGKQPLDLVWFRQLTSQDGSVKHSGDNLTGEGSGDDETITIALSDLPAAVHSLVFTVNSFRGQTFDQVENAFCRLIDLSSNTEVARYELSEKGQHTGVVMAVVTRSGGGWTVRAIGNPTHGRTAQDLVNLAIAAV
jgi:tellurium resistance protein TerZ